jgi:tetratricopeptide (TPR) repeat protein
MIRAALSAFLLAAFSLPATARDMMPGECDPGMGRDEHGMCVPSAPKPDPNKPQPAPGPTPKDGPDGPKPPAPAPDSIDALTRRAVDHQQAGDHKSAVADAREILSIDPHNQVALIIIGSEDSLSEKKFSAKPDFGAGPESSQGSSPRAAGLVPSPPAALPQQAREPGAPAAFVRSDTAPPSSGLQSPQDLVSLAEERLQRDDLKGAYLALGQATDQDPKYEAGWAFSADVAGKLGDYQTALRAAETALKLKPDDPRALRARAYAELMLGDYQHAYEDALRATRLDPQSGRGWLYLAMAEEKLGKLADALKHYELAVSLDSALAPLAREAIERLRGPSSMGLTSLARRRLMRGGIAAGSAILMFLGLLGLGARSRIKRP